MVLAFVVLVSAAAVAPIDIPLGSAEDSLLNTRRIRTRGTVVESFTDEIAPDTHFLILKDKGDFLIAFVPSAEIATSARTLLNAEIEVTGVLDRTISGGRNYIGPMLRVANAADIRVLSPPPADPFAVPRLDKSHFSSPREVQRRGRQRVSGRVLATWHGNRLLMSDYINSGVVGVRLTNGTPLPAPGETIAVVGYPESDLFRINLTRAIWKSRPASEEPARKLVPLTAAEATTDESGKMRYKPDHHGQLVRIRGVVRRLPPSSDGQWRIEVEDGGHVFLIDASSVPSATAGVPVGAAVEATGIGLLETTEMGPNEIFPHLKGFVVILRSPDDLRIVSHPPWWTVSRLAILVALLVVILIGVTAWNRSINRLAIRRGRALARKQLALDAAELKAAERTRLAVELHDTLSQNLASVAFLVVAGDKAIDTSPATAHARIGTAEQMLNSCRTELKNCLTDLRSDALEEPDFAEALRQSLMRIAGNADIRVRFDVSRRRLADTTAHAILAIVRELTANAIRHGNARTVRVAGAIEDGFLVFSVTDDGRGFDPRHAPGPAAGHFGLEGIRERVSRLHGTFTLVPRLPAGICAEIRIPVHPTTEEKT